MVISVNITNEIKPITNLLRQSFIGAADSMNLTKENCPYHVAFITGERLLKQLDRKDAYCFGIQQNGAWVGFVALAPYSDSYEITRLAVAPEYRHKGYGRTLMDAACEKAREIGLNFIGLGMMNENVILKKWYVSQGFIPEEPFQPEGSPYVVCGMSKKL